MKNSFNKLSILVFSIFISSQSLTANTTLPDSDETKICINSIETFSTDIRCEACGRWEYLKYHGDYDPTNDSYFNIEEIECSFCGERTRMYARRLVSELGVENLVIKTN